MTRYIKALQSRERADIGFRYWQTRVVMRALGTELPELPGTTEGREDDGRTMTERLMKEFKDAGVAAEEEAIDDAGQ